MTLEFAKRKTVEVTNWSNPFDAQFVHNKKKMHLAPSARSTHSKPFSLIKISDSRSPTGPFSSGTKFLDSLPWTVRKQWRSLCYMRDWNFATLWHSPKAVFLARDSMSESTLCNVETRILGVSIYLFLVCHC